MSFSKQTLFLDLASHEKLLALVTDGAATTMLRVNDHTQERALMGTIETLLAQANTSLKDLTRIASVTGPGGFMSVRVGVSIANALAWSLKIPLAGVHLSDIWAIRAQSSKPKTQSFVWLHSTKRNLLFIRGFGNYEDVWPEAVTLPIDDATKLLSMDVPYVGELIDEHVRALPGVKKIDDVAGIDQILPTLLGSLSDGNTPLEPWYGRGA